MNFLRREGAPIHAILTGLSLSDFGTVSASDSILKAIGKLGARIGAGGTFTPGSVLFAGSSGELAQDNANFFWDDGANVLRARELDLTVLLAQGEGGTNAASYGASRVIFQNAGNTAFSSDADFTFNGTTLTLKASGSNTAPIVAEGPGDGGDGTMGCIDWKTESAVLVGRLSHTNSISSSIWGQFGLYGDSTLDFRFGEMTGFDRSLLGAGEARVGGVAFDKDYNGVGFEESVGVVTFGKDGGGSLVSLLVVQGRFRSGLYTNNPSARLHIGVGGSSAAGTAPVKLTTGSYLAAPEAGTLEWNSASAENLTWTPTTTRYRIPLINSGALTSGRVTYATTNGRLTDSANLTFDGTTLTVSALVLTTALAATEGGTGFDTYTLGDTLYASSGTALSKLAGNITTTRKFLRQTGDGAASAAPAWDTLLDGDIPGTLSANARVVVRKNSGADVGTRRRLNFIEGANVTLTVADDAGNEEVDITIASSGGGGGSLSSVDIAFTDGDTARRVTVTDAGVSATSKIVGSIVRPDTVDDSADRGYIYDCNVVKRASGSFDLLVRCLDLSGGDPTLNPPNETVKFFYTVSA